jgi:hypothetical protein
MPSASALELPSSINHAMNHAMNLALEFPSHGCPNSATFNPFLALPLNHLNAEIVDSRLLGWSSAEAALTPNLP